MKAIVAPKYGGPEVLQYKEVDKPSPIDGEVLVKIHASSLNAHDFEILSGALTARMGRFNQGMRLWETYSTQVLELSLSMFVLQKKRLH
jgi:NADPH:quinone reductase-like Zn-dependent oxidoreductase